MRSFHVVCALVLFAACAKSTADPSTEPSGPEHPQADTVSDRPEITAEACEAGGGTVVGDIGDGAIHHPDYRCPENGEAPIGTIIAIPGGPTPTEGAVCCA